MQGLSSKHMMIAAALILAGGVVWAGGLLMSPPPAKAETGTIRQLSQRLSAEPAAQVADPTPGPISVLPEQPASTAAPRVTAKPAPKAAEPAAPPPAPVVSTPPPGPAPIIQPEDPVKNIALTGVAYEGGRDVAFLLDLNSSERQQVRAGDRAFGFTLRKVDADSVVLARGSSEYTVRLGDKAVPEVNVASAEFGSEFGDPNNPFGGRGRFGGGQNGFNFGRGGRGNFGGFGNRGFGNRGFGGFGNRGGFGGFGGDGNAMVFSSGDGPRGFSGGGGFSGGSSSSGSSSSSSWRDRNRGGGGGGSFQASFPIFGGGGGWGGRSSSSSTSSASRSTSNPQTARRNSSAYTYSGGTSGGGGGGMDTPDPINNPQTQRRLGTTSGPAFGQGQTSQYGGRTNSNRSGGSFNRLGGSTSFR